MLLRHWSARTFAFARAGKRGRKDGDDRDDHEQLNQSERSTSVLRERLLCEQAFGFMPGW
jgi:hypothetical protein